MGDPRYPTDARRRRLLEPHGPRRSSPRCSAGWRPTTSFAGGSRTALAGLDRARDVGVGPGSRPSATRTRSVRRSPAGAASRAHRRAISQAPDEVEQAIATMTAAGEGSAMVFRINLTIARATTSAQPRCWGAWRRRSHSGVPGGCGPTSPGSRWNHAGRYELGDHDRLAGLRRSTSELEEQGATAVQLDLRMRDAPRRRPAGQRPRRRAAGLDRAGGATHEAAESLSGGLGTVSPPG